MQRIIFHWNRRKLDSGFHVSLMYLQTNKNLLQFTNDFPITALKYIGLMFNISIATIFFCVSPGEKQELSGSLKSRATPYGKASQEPRGKSHGQQCRGLTSQDPVPRYLSKATRIHPEMVAMSNQKSRT